MTSARSIFSGYMQKHPDGGNTTRSGIIPVSVSKIVIDGSQIAGNVQAFNSATCCTTISQYICGILSSVFTTLLYSCPGLLWSFQVHLDCNACVLEDRCVDNPLSVAMNGTFCNWCRLPCARLDDCRFEYKFHVEQRKVKSLFVGKRKFKSRPRTNEHCMTHLTILILRDREMKFLVVTPSCSTVWVTRSLSSVSTQTLRLSSNRTP